MNELHDNKLRIDLYRYSKGSVPPRIPLYLSISR